MKMQNARALLPGASRPVGRAIARALAGRGVRLALPFITDWPQDAASLQEEFGGKGSPHLLFPVDLRDPNQVRAMAEELAGCWGGLEILINNIERGGMPVLHGGYQKEVNREQWQLEMETTLRAKWLLFDTCLPLLRKAHQASVVNLSSIAGLVGRSGPSALLFNDGYAAANRGIASLTETWARVGAPTIRVNELMLGLIDGRHGPGTRGWSLLTEEEKRRLQEHTLLGRTGTTDEVAAHVLFLVEQADYMTGCVLRLDGGYCLGGDKTEKMPQGKL